jgi:hypothetical protein
MRPKTVATVEPRKEAGLRGKVNVLPRIPLAAIIAMSARSARRNKPERPGEKRAWKKDVS